MEREGSVPWLQETAIGLISEPSNPNDATLLLQDQFLVFPPLKNNVMLL